MFRHARVGEETRRGRCEMGNISLRDPDTVTAADRGREFWRGVLLAGGFTAVPRWTLDPVPGIAEHEAKICNEVVTALRRLADELAVPLSSVLLTAHAKVVGALSGECKVSTGYSFEGRSPLLCRFTTEPHSWRAMLLKADRAQSELLAQKDFPVDDLRRELGLIKPLFETVFSLTPGDGTELAEETVVRADFVEQDGLVLRLRYRTDVLDADCARRIAGYYLTALALMAADPDAEHARQSLLSAEELHFQLNGLAGPSRKLPECRVHELFEERVRAHPDAIPAALIPASTSRLTNSRTSTLPPVPPVSPRARCASTRACSTTSAPRLTISGSARGTWWPRRRRSASTSRCGNWFPRFWSVGGRWSSSRRRSWTRGVSSAKSSTAGSTSFRSCRPILKSSSPIWSSTPASCRTCGACRSQARR